EPTAGPRAPGGLLTGAPLDCPIVMPGDHPTHDLVHELDPRPARQRSDPDPAVAVLAAAAGLLLVLPLPLRPALERLAVPDLRLRDLGVHPELACQPPHDALEMPLA